MQLFFRVRPFVFEDTLGCSDQEVVNVQTLSRDLPIDFPALGWVNPSILNYGQLL